MSSTIAAPVAPVPAKAAEESFYRIRGPLEYDDSPLARAARQPLLLGLFLNLQDISISSYPTSNTWTFDYNADIVRQGEALGFDIAFSRTQWLPKGGYDGDASLDSFIALGGMAAITKSILLISTIHVLYGPWHPLHLAKFGATLDHISQGRWGINIVTGHRAIEHEMFGWQRIEHDKRYTMAGELFDVLNRLWTEDENYSHESVHSGWKVSNGWITPKPLFGRPVLVTATGSPAGIDFASRYSDILFITSPGGAHIDSALETLPPHIETIRRTADSAGRKVKTLINPVIVSRDTERETQAYLDALLSHPPRPRGASFGHGHYDSDAHAWRGRQDKSHKQGYGLGGNIEIIGTPEQVVEKFIGLKQAGIDGLQLGFPDFRVDLEHFGESILPLMKSAGLRF